MNALGRIAIALLLTVGLGTSAQDKPPQPPANAPTFMLDDGSIIRVSQVAWPSTGAGYAFGIWKQRPDGSAEPLFNDTGFVAMPIWGYYEAADSLVVQRDGKIVVMGVAADPTIIHDGTCHPAFCGTFLAFIRLDSHGNLDYTFGTAGKVVLDYVADDALPQMRLRDDGMLDVLDHGAPIARLKADGSLDFSWIVAPASPPAGLYPFVQAQGRWKGSDAGNESSTLLVSHQGKVIFAAVARSGGTQQWAFGSFVRTGQSVYSGTFYSPSGSFAGWPFDTSTLAVKSLGAATLRLHDATNVAVEWSDGSGTVENFTRDKFGPPSGCAYGGITSLDNVLNLTDFWFDPAHPGWGVFIADNLFYQYAGAGDLWVTLFGYGSDRAPLVLQGLVPYLGYGSYVGDLSNGDARVEIDIDFVGGNDIYFGFSPRAGAAPSLGGGEARLSRFVYAGKGTACR
jgi:hypothetical protein